MKAPLDPFKRSEMSKVAPLVAFSWLALAVGGCQQVVDSSTTETFAVKNTTSQPVVVGVGGGSAEFGILVGPGYEDTIPPSDSVCVRPNPIGFSVAVWLASNTNNYWDMPSVGPWVVTVYPNAINGVPGAAC